MGPEALVARRYDRTLPRPPPTGFGVIPGGGQALSS